MRKSRPLTAQCASVRPQMRSGFETALANLPLVRDVVLVASAIPRTGLARVRALAACWPVYAGVSPPVCSVAG